MDDFFYAFGVCFVYFGLFVVMILPFRYTMIRLS